VSVFGAVVIDRLLQNSRSQRRAMADDENVQLSFVHEAAKRGYTEQIKEALENNKDSLNQRDSLGNTPLHWSCSGGHLAAVSLLIELGADVNITNQHGDTPLHKAAWKNYPAICDILIKHGASSCRGIKNQDGKTPLDLARTFEVQRLVAPPPEVQGKFL
jgi:ankyrin repeat protein